MEYQKIKTLLERYFQGETSVEEERLLRRYFSGEGVDQRLRQYAPLFRLFYREQQEKLDENKAGQILAQLPAGPANRISLSTRRYSRLLQIAASLVLIVGLYWAYQYRQPVEQTAEVDWSKYEITDEREALDITRNALLKVSKSLNEGASTAADKLDRMQEIGKFFK